MNTIQGNNVVLSLMKDDWVQLLCASDITLNLNLETLENKTVGDGHWASFAHEKLSYSIGVSGLAIVNDTDDQTNFSAFDQANHWIKSLYVNFLISFYDDAGDIKSFQGYALVSGLSFNISTGNLVKDDCTLTGTGELLFFDGLVACDSAITSITVTGQTAADGIIHIAYTYSGAPIQIKYRIDGEGSYITTAIDAPIDIPGLSLGSHSVEIIPMCLNGYDADNSASSAFVVTQSLTCSAVTTSIDTSGGVLTPVFSGSPAEWKYSIDGGMWVYRPISIPSVSIGALSIGAHTVSVVPICTNNVEGTGIINQAFTVTSNPAQSNIAYQFISYVSGNILQIYVDTGAGFILAQTPAIGTSGTFVVPTGSQVRGVLQGINNTGAAMNLETQDTTIATILDNQGGSVPNTFTFTFTTNGDDYSILGEVTP